MDLQTVHCPACGHVVCRGAMKGVIQTRCPNRKCRRRVHLMGDGQRLQVTFVDRAPARVVN